MAFSFYLIFVLQSLELSLERLSLKNFWKTKKPASDKFLLKFFHSGNRCVRGFLFLIIGDIAFRWCWPIFAGRPDRRLYHRAHRSCTEEKICLGGGAEFPGERARFYLSHELLTGCEGSRRRDIYRVSGDHSHPSSDRWRKELFHNYM